MRYSPNLLMCGIETDLITTDYNKINDMVDFILECLSIYIIITLVYYRFFRNKFDNFKYTVIIPLASIF